MIIENQIKDNTLLLSRIYSEQLDETLANYSSIAKDLGDATVTAINIETVLKNYRSRYPQFSQIFYIYSDYTIIDAEPYRSEFIGSFMGDEAALIESLEFQDTRITGVTNDFGEPSLLIFAPAIIPYIFGREPSQVGAVALVLPLGELFSDSLRREESDVFVAGEGGELIFSHSLQQNGITWLSEIDSDVSLDPILEAIEKGESGFAFFPVERETHYISFRSLDNVPWTLGLYGAFSDITREVIRTIIINIILVLICLGIGLFITYHIIRTVVKPIVELTRVAQQIAEGDRNVISTVDTSSEVGLLSDSLNSMIYELRFNHDSLELTVDERTSELKMANRELNSTVEELNASNRSLAEIRDNLEQMVDERNHDLSMANGFISNIIDSMPSQLSAVDREGRVTHWNREAFRRTGISSESAKGALFHDLLPQLSPYKDSLLGAVKSGETYSIPCLSRVMEGNHVHEEISLFPLGTGGAEGSVLRIDDITDRIEMEDSLRQSQKMEGIGQLTSGIAHDFNNMLGGIMGGAELLTGILEDHNAGQDYLNLILESAEQASDLTQKLLSFSRKSGRAFTILNIHQVLLAALAILERTLNKKIELKKDFAAEEFMVEGNRTQLQNAFLNLGINADHAMADGGVLSFHTRNVTLGEKDWERGLSVGPGDYIEIIIKDEGVGIEESVLNRIFEPFFTTKAPGKGTGLGLAAVYGTIQQHHGAIDVRSTPGQGTAFHIYFPVSEKAEVSLEKEGDSLIRGNGTVLVADDEPLLRYTLSATLKELGYEIFTACNGSEALNLYREKRDEIDVVILDMRMPVLDGKECFHRLREINPDLPIVIVSGFSREKDVDSLIENGLSAFLHKPYKMTELSRILARIMG